MDHVPLFFPAWMCHDEKVGIGLEILEKYITGHNSPQERRFMQQRKSPSPLGVQVKGIFFFKSGEEVYTKALELMKTLGCTIITDNISRMTVKTSRGNLQSIKDILTSKNTNSSLGAQLDACVTRIIIGGRA